MNSRNGHVLVLCPTHRDHRELARVYPHGQYLFHDYASLALEDIAGSRIQTTAAIGDPIAEIEQILARFRNVDIAAVISTDDYPGSTLACIIAKKLRRPAPEPAVNLLCQHKYRSRLVQQCLVPDTVPPFASLNVNDPALPSPFVFPVFVKPIKSFFSIGSQPVSSQSELATVCDRWKALDTFFEPFDRLLEHVLGILPDANRMIVESLLDGSQVTVEGFVFEGEVTILGVVDSVLFPGTLAFERFQYPSRLPLSVQERMALIAGKVIQGFGYDNGMFNIEMTHDQDSDRIFIIEINPRMASQFADLYEKVDGFNSYEILLDIALGERPHLKRNQGKHKVAASCVLRTFEDKIVVSLPSDAHRKKVMECYPDARIEILATARARLSAELQDGHSFRYGIISLGGRDAADIHAALTDCVDTLCFKLLPV
jgi:hypothetical protein